MIPGVVLECQSTEKEQAPHSQRASEGGPVHFQKLLCASYELLGAPMKLGAVWSCEGHHWGLESLAEAKSLDSRGQGTWADPIPILGFFLWVGPSSISGFTTVTFQNLPVHSAPNVARLRADFSGPDQEALRRGGYCSSALIEHRWFKLHSGQGPCHSVVWPLGPEVRVWKIAVGISLSSGISRRPAQEDRAPRSHPKCSSRLDAMSALPRWADDP